MLIVGLFMIPVVALGALLGATAIAQPQLLARQPGIFSVRVSGTVYGESAAQREAGREVMAPVAGATVNCGDASATSDASGHYSLNELRGRDYTCTASAAQYTATAATIHPQFAASYGLDFGASGAATAAGGACAAIAGGLRCGALALAPGSISGVVVDSATHQGVNSARVTCWDNSLAARTALKNPTSYISVADAQGQYTIPSAPVGPYACVAGPTQTPRTVVARPGAAAALDLTLCQSHCRGATFHQGDVLHTVTVYALYWSPPGTRLDPHGSDSRFHTLVAQFVNDLSGTRFYSLLGQYWDFEGPVRDVVRFGGAYVDTHAFPHAGTTADPLSDQDIFKEIGRANQSAHWPLAGGTSAVAIFTPYGVETCNGFGRQRSCSFPLQNNTGFCAYHSYDTYGGYPVDASAGGSFDLPYMLITAVPGCDSLPTFGEAPAPYGAPVVDAVINSLSHELFETVSDPTLDGWYDGGHDGEIADKCEESFGVPARDGSTVRLAHGHGYAVQREWSQASGACSYG